MLCDVSHWFSESGPRLGHFQLCTDGFEPHRSAIPGYIGNRIDYAMAIKVFGKPPADEARCYSRRPDKGHNRLPTNAGRLTGGTRFLILTHGLSFDHVLER
jgi:hypothetical protein